MNSKNSKTSKPHILTHKLLVTLDLRSGEKEKHKKHGET